MPWLRLQDAPASRRHIKLSKGSIRPTCHVVIFVDDTEIKNDLLPLVSFRLRFRLGSAERALPGRDLALAF
jgi:hypothetical protein